MRDHQAVERYERSHGSRERREITRQWREMTDHKVIERYEKSKGNTERERQTDRERVRERDR